MENESLSKEIGGREGQGGKWGPQALQQGQRGCLFLWSLLQQMSGKGLLHLHCDKTLWVWGMAGAGALLPEIQCHLELGWGPETLEVPGQV